MLHAFHAQAIPCLVRWGLDTGSLSCWRTKEPHLEMIGVVSAAHRATTKRAVTGNAAYNALGRSGRADGRASIIPSHSEDDRANNAMPEITFVFGPDGSFFFDCPKTWKCKNSQISRGYRADDACKFTVFRSRFGSCSIVLCQ